MLDEYNEKYYSKLAVRAVAIKADECSMARTLADWKTQVSHQWDEVVVKSVKVPDSSRQALRFGESFKAEVELNCGSLSPEDIGMEVVFGLKQDGRKEEALFVKPLELKGSSEGTATFSCEFGIEHAGVLDYAIRMFPVSSLLAYKQETGILRYI